MCNPLKGSLNCSNPLLALILAETGNPDDDEDEKENLIFSGECESMARRDVQVHGNSLNCEDDFRASLIAKSKIVLMWAKASHKSLSQRVPPADTREN